MRDDRFSTPHQKLVPVAGTAPAQQPYESYLANLAQTGISQRCDPQEFRFSANGSVVVEKFLTS